jgi:uncharacterized OB-fold protein
MAPEAAKSRYCLPPGAPMPDPARSAPFHHGFWEAAHRHELVVQRCRSCAIFQFGPEEICYQCHSFDLSWERVDPSGRIFSWERIWHSSNPALKDACPYVVVLVELPQAGNVRMLGNLLGDPRRDPPIGEKVEAVFEDHDEGYTLVQWRLVQ